MDEVISFLVFIVIVGFSILGKIKSERKAAQEREQEPVEPGGVETIPEPLRRMLFGDGEGDVIVAEPKEPQQSGKTFPDFGKSTPSPVPARQVVFERTVTVSQPPRVSPQKPVILPEPEPKMRQQKQQTVPQHRRPPQSVRKQTHVQPKQPTAPVPQAEIQATRSPKPVVLKQHLKSKSGLPAMLRSHSGLVQGILLHEILSRPRAFDI